MLRVISINRTKVELKCKRPEPVMRYDNYQSYQSGIETIMRLLGAIPGILSIVPKWN